MGESFKVQFWSISWSYLFYILNFKKEIMGFLTSNISLVSSISWFDTQETIDFFFVVFVLTWKHKHPLQKWYIYIYTYPDNKKLFQVLIIGWGENLRQMILYAHMTPNIYIYKNTYVCVYYIHIHINKYVCVCMYVYIYIMSNFDQNYSDQGELIEGDAIVSRCFPVFLKFCSAYFVL